MKHSSFFILFLLVAMIGCKGLQPMMATTSRYDIEHSNINSHNEYANDSTFIDRLREVIIRNDTVFIHDSIYIFKWRDRQVSDTIIDTLYINRTDSIQIPVEIEKPIAPFVRNSCIALWSIIGVAILALIIWLVWNFATGKFSWHGIISKIFKLFIR